MDAIYGLKLWFGDQVYDLGWQVDDKLDVFEIETWLRTSIVPEMNLVLI